MFPFMLWAYQVLVWGQYGTGTNRHAQPWSGMNRQHTFLYMWNLETLRTVYDKATVGKEEGASVGDCTLNLRWNPWLVSTVVNKGRAPQLGVGVLRCVELLSLYSHLPITRAEPSFMMYSWQVDPMPGVQTHHKFPSVHMQHGPSVLGNTEASSLRISPSVLSPFSWGHRASHCWKATVFILSRFHVSFHGEIFSRKGKEKAVEKYFRAPGTCREQTYSQLRWQLAPCPFIMDTHFEEAPKFQGGLLSHCTEQCLWEAIPRHWWKSNAGTTEDGELWLGTLDVTEAASMVCVLRTT